MNKDLHSFQQFMKEREEASRSFVNGDVAPLDTLSTHVSPATIFGPQGDCVSGANKVNAANAVGAKMFESGSDSSFEILQMGANDEMAYWAGMQRSTVQMKGNLNAIPMDLRVTEIFRLEDGEWKLVHRHADGLKSETTDA